MEKRYNLVRSGLNNERCFLYQLSCQSLRNTKIELVNSGSEEVYHILDSTVKFDSLLSQRESELKKPYERNYAHPFLQINASNKRKIKRTVSLLENSLEEQLEEIKGEEK